MTDELQLLARVPLFSHLDEPQLEQLSYRSAVRTVAAGTVVAEVRSSADHLIVVETGALTALVRTSSGRTRRLGEFTAPCAVDKTAVLDNAGHTATWVAAAKSRLRLIRRADLLALVDDIPAVRRHVLLHLAAQVRDQQDGLVRAALADTTARVADWLLRAAAENGERVVLPGAQEGLGEAVGASRVSVNRALRKLADLGVIRTEPGAVTVVAPELLAQHAMVGEN